MKTYHYEVYTNNPLNDESGWDIETGYCEADSLEHAKMRIKNTIANFDVFINVFHANMNKTDKLTF